MKNCYFFRGAEGIWAQGKRKSVMISKPSVTISGVDRRVVRIRDMDTGEYFYPAEGQRKIQ